MPWVNTLEGIKFVPNSEVSNLSATRMLRDERTFGSAQEAQNMAKSMNLPSNLKTNLSPTEQAWAQSSGSQETGGGSSTASQSGPTIPDITSLLDEAGNLKSQYKLAAKGDVGFTSNLQELNDKLAGINLNKEGLEAIRKRALSTGPSDWQNLMIEKQKLEEDTQRNSAQEQEASGRSSAYSQLASKGGLSTGARERLARSGADSLASTMQDISRGGVASRLGIATEDEQQKLNLLSQLPGMEVQALQPEFEKTRMWGTLADSESGRKQNLDLANRNYASSVDQFNLVNTLGEVGRQDQARLGKYGEQMKAYAAEQQAKATAASGGGKK